MNTTTIGVSAIQEPYINVNTLSSVASLEIRSSVSPLSVKLFRWPSADFFTACDRGGDIVLMPQTVIHQKHVVCMLQN